jgi:hypothetical protein
VPSALTYRHLIENGSPDRLFAFNFDQTGQVLGDLLGHSVLPLALSGYLRADCV